MEEITKVNSKGVVTLPRSIRESAGLLTGNQVQVKITPDHNCLKT